MKNLGFFLLSLLLVTGGYTQVGIGTASPNSTLQVVGSFSAGFRSFTASTSASSTDYTLVFTGTTASSVTLPDATTCAGRVYFIKNASTTGPVPLVTIITTSSQTIDGNASWLLDLSFESVILISDGANWKVSAQTANTSGTAWIQGGNTESSIQTLGTISNFALPIITNNVERMRIDVSGSVGIGTTSPVQKLDVNGNFKLSGAFMPGNSAGTAGNVLISGGTGAAPLWFDESAYLNANAWVLGGNSVGPLQELGTTTNFSLPIITNNIERMRIDSLGNVAIGGSIASGATNAEKFLINANTTTSPNLISAKGSINSYLQLNIQNTASTALASTDLITTNDAGSYVDLGINSSGYSTVGSPLIGGAGNAYLYSTGNDFIIGDSTIGKNLIFFTGGAMLTNERMRIDGNGNTGIGTTSPNALLDVSGSVAHAIITTISNLTLDATNCTVILTGGTPIITLPAAGSTNARRMYIIVNQTGASRTISSFKNFSGTNTTTIATASSITIQSDGTNWYRIQ